MKCNTYLNYLSSSSLMMSFLFTKIYLLNQILAIDIFNIFLYIITTNKKTKLKMNSYVVWSKEKTNGSFFEEFY
jgi:hypothetical protein